MKNQHNRIVRVCAFILALLFVTFALVLANEQFKDFFIATLVRLKKQRGSDIALDTVKHLDNVRVLSTSFMLLAVGFLFYSAPSLRAFVAKHKIVLGSLFAISFLSSLILCIPGIHEGADIRFHLMRIEGLKDALLAGQFPVRLQYSWINGYGYPVSIFYGDFLLYIPAVLRIVGIAPTTAYKIYIFVINVLTATMSFWCFKNIFKKQGNSLALLLSFVYTTACYRLTEIYVISAVGTFSAFLFFPPVALAVYNIYTVKEKSVYENALLLALSMTGLLCTHILSTELVIFALALVAILLAKRTFTKKVLFSFCAAILFTCLLGAAFIVPFLDCAKNVPMLIFKHKSSVYNDSGLYIGQLFAFFQTPFGGVNPNNVQGRELLSPGIPLMAGLVAAIVLLVYKKRDKTILFFTILSGIYLYLASNLFTYSFLSFGPLGKITGTLQYSIRNITIATLLLTLLLGYVFIAIMKLFKENQHTRYVVGGGYSNNDTPPSMHVYQLVF